MNHSETSAVTPTHSPEDTSEDFTRASVTGTSVTDTGADLTFALLASHALFRAAVWVYKVSLVLIFVVGVVGNTMILVLQRHLGGGRDSGLSVFVTSLAVSDCVSLLIMGGLYMYPYSYQVDIANFHDVLCRMIYYFMYVTALTSSWILVAMTMQRAASILWPHRVNAAWTARKARSTVLVIVVTSLVLNSHILYGRGLQSLPSGQQLCLFVSEEYGQFFDRVWPSVDIVLNSFVPFVLIISSNVVLVRRVRQSMRDARGTLVAGSKDQLKARETQASGMTLTLVCVSLAFLLLTSPICIFSVVKGTGGHASFHDVSEAVDDYFAEAIANVLLLANNAINFYIYALTGRRYRAAMAQLCGCHAPKKATSVTTLTTVTRPSECSVAQSRQTGEQ